MSFPSPHPGAEPLRVVVVGGGAAGAIAAIHLLRATTAARPIDLRIVEERAVIGPGLAYRTVHPLHTLNNFAGRLSAVDGDPDHLLRWCAARGLDVTPTSFLQRALYGRYLSDTLDRVLVPTGSVLRRTQGTAVDVVPVDEGRSGFRVVLQDARAHDADEVVLALGNPPPRAPLGVGRLGARYLPDPWAEDLPARVAGAREVLVLGTGLTMVDAVAMLRRASPGTRFTAVSRSGLLPQVHRRETSRLHDIFDPGAAASLDTVMERVEARIEELRDAGGDWRDVVDSLRAVANRLWRALSDDDQDRFVAEVARRWETSRHRMSPEVADHLDALLRSGRLQVRRLDEVDPSAFDHVVNCTGPAPVPTAGWNPLVDALLARGVVRPHRLGLGLDLDADGRTLGGVERGLHVLGAARRGLEWEVAAVPDLRTQGARLADLLAREGRVAGRSSPVRGPVSPGHSSTASTAG